MKRLPRTLAQTVFAFGIFFLAAAVQTYAFTDPSSAPPVGSGFAPINTGISVQNKEDSSGHAAWITADGVGSRYGALFATSGGRVGIGTTNPQGTLDVDSAAHNATICLNGNCISSW